MRRRGKLAALVAGGLLAAGSAAPAALAADDCPNAAVRAQQSAQHLPNCFAYERVTPNDKNGSAVQADSPVSPDGTAVSVWSTTHMIDGEPGSQQLGAAYRGSDGWTTRTLSNAKNWGRFRLSGTADAAWWSAMSTDLRSLVFRTPHPLYAGDQGTSTYGAALSTTDLYLTKPDGSTTWITAPVSGIVPAVQQEGVDPRFWSGTPDLTRMVFDTTRVLDPSVDGTVRAHLWLYQDGRPLELVDRLPNGSLSLATEAPSGFIGPQDRATSDLRRIVFLSSGHVYVRIDAGTPQARTVLVSANAAGTPCPEYKSFNSITENGRYVRFTCGAALTPDAPANGGVYVRDLETGAVTYDVPEVDRGSPAVIGRITSTWTRPEGTYRVQFGSGATANQIVRTDLTSGTQTCVSCPADGSAPTGTSGWGGLSNGANGGAGITAYGAVTPEGEVVFWTTQRLVPEDTNTFADVYMWKDGRQYLLSAGNTSNDVEFGGVSLDGSTITFSTTRSLVPEDQDGGARDLYVVRRNGGFFRPAEPDECRAGCQGPAFPVGPLLRPLSVDFVGSGDVVDNDPDPIAVSGSRTVTGKTSLKVKVKLPAAGRVTVSGNGLRAASKSVKSATSVTLTAKLSARSQRLLKKRSSLRLKATVRYAPANGSTQSTRVSLTFKKQAKKTKKKGSSRSVAAATSGKAAR